MSESALKGSLLAWYRSARRDLPWRRARDPYAIWVSETMLQQTRVETVLPYYERFMRELPTLQSLAEAPEERVLALWSGLGYYRRARMLRAAAQRVASAHGGRVPSDADALRALPGVGEYTAGAIASIAFGRPAALVDGNVARVLARLFAVEDDIRGARGRAVLWEIARRLVAQGAEDPGDWNQALMELGATVCTPREPRCAACPARDHCRALALGVARELPRVGPRRAPLVVRRAAVVLSSRTSVLLARRRPETLWGGLWEPPTVEGDLASLVARLGIDASAITHAGEVVHVLTHRRMHVEVAWGALPRRRVWPLPGAEYDAVEPVPLRELALAAGQREHEHERENGRPRERERERERETEPEPGASRAHSTLARKVLRMANVPARGLPWKK
ncbi:MAG: A/G-specific adenine glycosylase [Myxococcales bacterium]|nr:A/G-specific adenine glycosylase [Myxococcales bacterium]